MHGATQAAKKPASAGKTPSSAGKKPASAGKRKDGALAGALCAIGRVTTVGQARAPPAEPDLSEALAHSAPVGKGSAREWDQL